MRLRVFIGTPLAFAFAMAVAAVTVSFAATPLAAQGSLREQTAGKAGGPQQVIAVNPFLPIAGYFQAEFERKLRDNASVALAGSFVPWNNDYVNVDAKLRLYPQDRALEGLGLSAGLGVGRAKTDVLYGVCPPEPTCDPIARPGTWVTAPTFSIEAQYQWLMGRSRATAVTIGGGAKRYFFSGDEVVGGVMRVVPTGRITIGWGF